MNSTELGGIGVISRFKKSTPVSGEYTTVGRSE